MKSSDIEQADRRKLVGSTTSATTYREIAEAGITLANQGRFGDKASVVGSARVPQYPAASGPWNDPVQVPDEPSLGVDLNYVEPCGETFEVEASLAAQPTDSLTSGGAAGSGSVDHSPWPEPDPSSNIAMATGDAAPSSEVSFPFPRSDGANLLRRARRL
jgi:hypothetical protein